MGSKTETWIFRLRLGSGLTVFSYVFCHLVNHAFGLVSVRWMNQANKILVDPWTTDAGTVVLLTAGLTHTSLAWYAIYRRRCFSLKLFEWWQLLLGLSIPYLMLYHIMLTKVSTEILLTNTDYYSMLVTLWHLNTLEGLVRAVSVCVVWGHACIGLYNWLRFKAFYARWATTLEFLAFLIPAAALAGYVSAGNQILRQIEADPDFVEDIIFDSAFDEEVFAIVLDWAQAGWAIVTLLILSAFIARLVRRKLQELRKRPNLTLPGRKPMSIDPGASVLEVLKAHGVPHASVCGGRARCTTCRVRITAGRADLPDMNDLERRALEAIGAPDTVRLACQLRPMADVAAVPLLAPDASLEESNKPGGLEGQERSITILFLDLRGSTKLGEQKLAYDVLFILNQFFTEMTDAIRASKGHYSQFTGDGLMALYGLEGSAEEGARQAVEAASLMLERLDSLNKHLASELDEPLRMGIGIHHGDAIVGTMGPPTSEILSAIGDTVNTTARLESLTKDYDVPFILSARAARVANMDIDPAFEHTVTVKGRVKPVSFYALEQVPEFSNPA